MSSRVWNDKRRAVEKIDSLLEDSRTVKLVEAFYNQECARGYSNKADFIGELFTTLGHTPHDSFEADDLLAVHLMGMRFTVSATKALLEPGRERNDVCDLLSDIRFDVDIWDDDADLSDQSAADSLWQRLRGHKNGYDGIGWVTAGKLLARKRPRLIPVIDRRITNRVPLSDDTGYWVLFQEYLRQPKRRKKVDSLRPEGVPSSSTPTLRLLDTAIWMHGSNGLAKVIRERLDPID